MSQHVRLWLRLIGRLDETNHDDRIEIDRLIEEKVGINCDEALAKNLMSIDEFSKLVDEFLKKKKKIRKEEWVI